MQSVHDKAESSNLFDKGDIKVRLTSYSNFNNGNSKKDFIHVFANVMEGRTTEQKSLLSKLIVKELKHIFNEVPIISMNIRDFEKATYCNKSMV
jgi:5-carboxymethyl-2-hydroxymuconate isomerase